MKTTENQKFLFSGGIEKRLVTWHELTDTLEKKHEQLLGSAQPQGGSWGKITTNRRFIGIAFFELLGGNSDILVTTSRHMVIIPGI